MTSELRRPAKGHQPEPEAEAGERAPASTTTTTTAASGEPTPGIAPPGSLGTSGGDTPAKKRRHSTTGPLEVVLVGEFPKDPLPEELSLLRLFRDKLLEGIGGDGEG